MDWLVFAAGFFIGVVIHAYDLYLFQKATREVAPDIGEMSIDELDAALARLEGEEFKARKRYLGNIRWEHGR